jgi:membrane-associated protease RseP (regulator of RpoE activity)
MAKDAVQAPQPPASTTSAKEKVTWLGVSTHEAPPVLSDQIDLPRDTGLVVDVVLPDSPAAVAGIQIHDVLTSLDDQILANGDQLRVLIRNRQHGDKATLTFLRKGNEHKATVTLGEHEVPKMIPFGGGWNAMPGHYGGFGSQMPKGGGDVEPVLPMDELPMGKNSVVIQGQPVGGHGATSRVQYSDQEHTIAIQSQDGKQTITIANLAGEVLYTGPFGTEEEKAQVPAEYRNKVNTIKVNQQRIPPEMLVPIPAPANRDPM